MASGVDEMKAVLEEIKSEVMANPCNMGDVAMRAMASALRTLPKQSAEAIQQRNGGEGTWCKCSAAVKDCC